MWIIIETIVEAGDGQEELSTKVWGPFNSRDIAKRTAIHNKMNTFEVYPVIMPTSKPAW